MFNIIFPIKLHLTMLQLEGYKIKRFIKWIFKNYFVRSTEEKRALVWTSKAKVIFLLSIIYLLLDIVFLTFYFKFSGFIFSLFLFTQPYLYLIAATISFWPFEYLYKLKVKKFVRNKITNLKKEGLVIIGITGSYGKTTTKEFLYKLLKTEYKVFKTPESYNTLLGIYKVVNYELTKGYDYFICEMGAYELGDIQEICDMVLPDHGILTGINEQHLERFGSISTTIKTKFELIQAISEKGLKILNGDSENVLNNYEKYVRNPILYGKSQKEHSFANINYINGKTNFDLIINKNKYEIKNLNIAGEANISNLVASIVAATKLNISLENILEEIKKITPVAHRLEVKEFENYTLIDNAYSSNVSGFKVALDLLSSYKDRVKILVTPGIVELGDKTNEIHSELGVQVNKVCDYVLLVGKSDRTKALSTNIDEKKVIYLDSVYEYITKVNSLNLEKPAVLLENDLTQNY